MLVLHCCCYLGSRLGYAPDALSPVSSRQTTTTVVLLLYFTTTPLVDTRPGCSSLGATAFFGFSAEYHEGGC